MKTWMRFGIGAAALVVAVAVGTAAYAMRDDADDPPITGSDNGGAESACLVGTADCNDTPGEGLNQSCLVGTPDCVDADLGGDAANCADDVVDCRDTGGGTERLCVQEEPGSGPVVCDDTVPYSDFGELPAECVPDAVDCVDPAACPLEGCSYEECTTTPGATPEEDVVTCQGYGCSEPQPAPDPLVDPAFGAPEPAEDLPLADPQVGGPETSAGEPAAGADRSGCLGVDPCTISSEQMCPPPDCAVSSDGTTTCYDVEPICAAPEDANEPAVCEDTVPPSEGEGSTGSGGSGGTEPGSSEPEAAP